MNFELKREAEFFGDIVIVPFLDSYDLVVLKTVAICEYGVCINYSCSYYGFVSTSDTILITNVFLTALSPFLQ